VTPFPDVSLPARSHLAYPTEREPIDPTTVVLRDWIEASAERRESVRGNPDAHAERSRHRLARMRKDKIKVRLYRRTRGARLPDRRARP
jgi:hypothetical protein